MRTLLQVTRVLSGVGHSFRKIRLFILRFEMLKTDIKLQEIMVILKIMLKFSNFLAFLWHVLPNELASVSMIFLKSHIQKCYSSF